MLYPVAAVEPPIDTPPLVANVFEPIATLNARLSSIGSVPVLPSPIFATAFEPIAVELPSAKELRPTATLTVAELSTTVLDSFVSLV